ncbi:hypothetical protein AAMO2058_001105700 [Amorphochlora amoebiformis]
MKNGVGLKVTLREKKLTQLPESLKGSICQQLDLTGNCIGDLTSLAEMKNLRRLILDKNGLTSLQSLPLLSNLQTLWINNNKLNNLIDVAMKLHKSTSNLTYLSMMKNPLCPDIFKDPSLEKSYRRYRLLLIYRLPSLKFLDSSPVTTSERKQAQKDGPKLERMRGVQGNIASGEGEIVKDGRNSDMSPPKQPAAFLAKGYFRYNGTQSEGNRFILNNEL